MVNFNTEPYQVVWKSYVRRNELLNFNNCYY